MPALGAVVLGSAGFYLSHLYRALGDRTQHVRWLVTGVEAMERTGSRGYASSLLAMHASALLSENRTAEALALRDRAEAVTSRFDTMSVGECLACRAVVAGQTGHHDEARSLADRALARIEETDQLVERADLRRLVALAARAAGDHSRVRSLTTEARDLYAAKGARAYQAQAERELAG